MCISDEIMEKVKDKELCSKDFNRCLDVSICPRCGGNLKKTDIDVNANSIDTKYTCKNCNFAHTRLEP